MNRKHQTPAGDAAPPDACALENRNRRMGPDRRQFDDPGYRGPERRCFGRRRLSDEIETFFERLGGFLCRHRFAGESKPPVSRVSFTVSARSEKALVVNS